jgi:hypothetical protein
MSDALLVQSDEQQDDPGRNRDEGNSSHFARRRLNFYGGDVSDRYFGSAPGSRQESEPDTSDTTRAELDGFNVRESLTTQAQRVVRGIRPVLPPPIRSRGQFTALAQWEGIVLDAFDDYFVARVVPLDGGPKEDMEFPLSEVSTYDRELVQEGALFFWSIGYFDAVSGQRTRSSVIRFRRLPRRSVQQLQAASTRAARLLNDLGVQ